MKYFEYMLRAFKDMKINMNVPLMHPYTCAILSYVCYILLVHDFRLRSSKAPDKTADMGTHEFTYALMPYFGKLWIWDKKRVRTQLRRWEKKD